MRGVSFRAAATLLLAAAFAPAVASAASPELESAIRDLGSTDGEKVKRALATIGDRGETDALPALDAFTDDRLRVGSDGAIYVRDSKKDALVDPLTGAVVKPEPPSLRTVEMDNETRRLAAPVVARLRLSASDPAMRLAAAEELAQPDESLIPLLRAALAKETKSKVRAALSLSLARHDLQSPTVEQRLAALETLRQLARPATRGEIESLLKSDPDKRVQAAGAA